MDPICWKLTRKYYCMIFATYSWSRGPTDPYTSSFIFLLNFVVWTYICLSTKLGILGDVHIKWIDWYSCSESFMVHLYFAPHSLPSVGAAGKVGILLAIMAAFPRWSSTPSRDQVWLIASPSSCPLCLARAPASFLTWSTATSCQPPNVSAARGRKVIPW